jgi:hypothetical protein
MFRLEPASAVLGPLRMQGGKPRVSGISLTHPPQADREFTQWPRILPVASLPQRAGRFATTRPCVSSQVACRARDTDSRRIPVASTARFDRQPISFGGSSMSPWQSSSRKARRAIGPQTYPRTGW